MRLIFNIDKDKKQIQIIEDLIELFKGENLLVLNLLQETRAIEIVLGIEDLIIYNSYDYLNGVCDFDKALQEGEIDILPSAFDKKEDFSLDRFARDLKDLDYDHVFIIKSKELELDINGFRRVELLYEGQEAKDDYRIVLLNKKTRTYENTYLYIDEDYNDFDIDHLKENLLKGEFDQLNSGFIGKFKKLFR